MRKERCIQTNQRYFVRDLTQKSIRKRPKIIPIDMQSHLSRTIGRSRSWTWRRRSCRARRGALCRERRGWQRWTPRRLARRHCRYISRRRGWSPRWRCRRRAAGAQDKGTQRDVDIMRLCERNVMVMRKTAAKRKKENRTNSPRRWDARRAERRAARWVLRRNVRWAAASGRSWNAKHNIYLDPGD